jgi:hypothetical protein
MDMEGQEAKIHSSQTARHPLFLPLRVLGARSPANTN